MATKDFFRVLSVEQFVANLKDFPSLPGEDVGLDKADGRILVRDLIPDENLPLAHRSCMDGYAVHAADLFGAGEMNPAYLECVGSVDIQTPPDFTLEPGQCAAIVTGGCLPEGADAVMMVEYTEELGAGTIEIRKAVAPTENVMLRGEDAKSGEPALAAGTVLRPQEVGLLAALGWSDVPVCRAPRVGILSTGDELVPVEQKPEVGQVRDVNSWTLAALVRRAGGVPKALGLVPDVEGALAKAMREALEDCDVLLVSGGSSVGMRDFTVDAVQALPGGKLLAHGVAISPGKPLILARVDDPEDAAAPAKAVWGLPGQVASAMVTAQVLLLPFLRHLQGDPAPFGAEARPRRRAVLARNVASKPGREDYVRIRLDEDAEGGLPRAVPVPGKSGLLRTLLEADGLLRIPADSEGLSQGMEVDIWVSC